MSQESIPENVRLQMNFNALVSKVQPLIVGASLVTECLQMMQAYQNQCNAYVVELSELKKKLEQKP